MKQTRIDWRAEAERIERRLERLSRISEREDALDRPPFTPSLRRAMEEISRWMVEAELLPAVDSFGNLLGRRRPRENGQPVLLIGSHLDTVPNGGRFDGALGILLGIAAAGLLRPRARELPFALEVVAFHEEEGVRFRSGCLGSRAFLGLLDEEDWELADTRGISLRTARDSFSTEGWPRVPPYPPAEIFGYLEAHIEQGPQLEALGLPLGVVAGIVAQERLLVSFAGESGHAGSVPMHARRDALCAAAEFVGFVEESARREPGAVATVGELHCQPGAVNVIPKRVDLSVDLRHPAEATLDRLSARLRERAREIGKSRGIEVGCRRTQRLPAARADAGWQDRLASAVAEIQGEAPRLWSGAGHDAGVLGRFVPMGMLFLRCRGGISHDPAEFVSVPEIACGLEAMVGFLEGFLP
ncbi:M20 family metallo-hydrolase [Methylacidimicrobium sp. AP8]|uniref:M20 family metallo-hydrolase n=1 Tax=Methylacidimicrobium sp. AP8 TaxID=2730359 RepID=UPI0019228005|nr:M20 family metallo-hydrolase [Methylacidimicrobium sp. AP8]